ncbi:MAG: ABC transporter substrate-binding protein [Armatimonadota bacterium]|nr:ABC transporter substrate-binding protein [bacterium]MCS7308998.1 ABC transporter substrate-binding protein [Armatimonadota bacterium]MDW8103447.1 ABC transporter substrate-binding protein [Armatimonadota bacterium]MDW8289573.1 ABC transporter substrate-binding protein [Armatimonadota bacterium]
MLSLGAQAQRAPGGKEQPVRIGYLPILDAAPLLVAHARKMFEAEGLQAETPRLFRAWPALIEAFLARQVNVVHILMPSALLIRYGNRFPAKVVAWNHTNGSALTVQPHIRSLQQLGGQRVAIPFYYSLHNILLQEMLRREGMQPVLRAQGRALRENEVELVVMPPPDMVSALANRSIAGYIVADPFNAAAEANRVGRVLRLSGDVWRDHACCVVLMHEDDLSTRSDWAQAVVNAVVKAQVWIRANRAETARLLSRESGSYTPHPEAVLRRVLVQYDPVLYAREGAIRHPEWKVPRIDFQPYPFPSYTQLLVRLLQRTQVEGNRDFLRTLNPQQVSRDLVDDRFVRKAIASVGGARAFGLPVSLSRQERFEP